MANPNPNTKGLKPMKKGETRNPKGKPKGTLNAKTVIRKWLEMTATETIIDPKTKRKKTVQKKDADGNPITFMDAMVVAQIKKAVSKNDTAAFSALLDRLEGRPKQTTDITLPTGAVVMIGGQALEDE